MPGNNEHKSCPSSTCSEDAILLGKVKQDGTVGFLQNKMTLDVAAVAAFQQAGEPERHFRFSSPCVQKGCGQWSNGKCGVIKEVLGAFKEIDLPQDAPSCLIRSTCRWFHQEGVQACYACAFVVTDLRPALLPVE